MSTVKTPRIYRIFYADALERVRRVRREYEAEVADWYTNGDGRPVEYVVEVDEETGEVYRYNAGGQGHAFPQCIHGASLWTDYDNICGGCEESLSEVEEARAIARERWLRFCERFDWYMSAPSDLRTQQPEAHEALTAWTFRLLPGYNK